MTTTATAIDNFAKTMRAHATKKVGDDKAVREIIHKCITTLPPLLDEKQVGTFLKARAKVLSDLLDKFLVARLTSRYALIDPSLFKMKRYLMVGSDGKLIQDTTIKAKRERNVTKIEIPLFASVFLNGDRTVTLGQRFIRSRRLTREFTQSIRIQVTLPVPPPEIIRLGHKAMGYYHSVIGEIYADDELCHLLHSSLPAAEIGVVWIPTPTSLNIEVETKMVASPRRVDPAITLSVNKQHFLIGMYDIPTEEPLEHYLREFTSGTTKIKNH